MTPQIPIYADRISVGYDTTLILNELSFRANAGELTVLVGPNGCGKSTLLKSLARVLSVSSGAICLGEMSIQQADTRTIAKTLAFLPQGPVAPDGLSVRELVGQGRFPHQSLLRQWSKEDARVVSKVLAQTNLNDLAERPLTQLSGGQRQRAWIAMVLAQNTPVILLDEPTAFLDLKVQVELLSLLQHIAHQEGRTVVVVLHDLNLAAAFADRMVMIKKGEILAEGEVDEIFNQANLASVFDLETSILKDPQNGRPICSPKMFSTQLGGSY